MMNILKKLIKMVKKIIDKIKFRIKLQHMDSMWYSMGGSCWGIFPPSFYYTHTEDEIERIKEETMRSLQEIIDKLKEEETESE
ncbi:hypothetical protein [Otoolea muris]|uniref:hypothetical protein n=1 Tax=Otoolea muris TaxID=2941515 RepID=UPI002042644D|nr:hypothetical protein [Otoolea muris]